MFDPREKIAVLIDGANLYSASRALGFDIDYRRLLADFRQLHQPMDGSLNEAAEKKSSTFNSRSPA